MVWFSSDCTGSKVSEIDSFNGTKEEQLSLEIPSSVEALSLSFEHVMTKSL